MKKEKHKLYIVRKYIKARDAAEAIRKDKKTKVHDVFVDESFKDRRLTEAIGFEFDKRPEEDDEMPDET